MHQAMVRQQANARLGTSNTLRRGEVAAAPASCIRKAPGRARRLDPRAQPQGWRRGAWAAPAILSQGYAAQMRRLAACLALSAKFAADEICFVDGWSFERPRTKDFLNSLSSLQLDGKTLIVLDQKDAVVQKSANNLAGVKTLMAHYLNVIDLLNFDTVVISRAAVDVIESYLGQGDSATDADTAHGEA